MQIDINDVKEMLGQKDLVILQLQAALKQAQQSADQLAQTVATQADEKRAAEEAARRERMAESEAAFAEAMSVPAEPDAGTV